MVAEAAFDLALATAELRRRQAAETFSLQFQPFLESTMNEAADREARGEAVKPGDVYIAGRQAGTGARGPWYTGPRDIAMTCVLPDVAAMGERYLRAAAGSLAVIAAVEELAGGRAPALYFKWPNDVFTARNQKLCGTISTSRSDPARNRWLSQSRGLRISPNWLLLGIGINLGRLDRSVSDKYEPISVEDFTGTVPAREPVIAAVLAGLKAYLDLLDRDRQRFIGEIEQRLLVGPGRRILIVPPGVEPPESDERQQFAAVLTGLSGAGVAVVRADDGAPVLLPFEQVGRILPAPE